MRSLKPGAAPALTLALSGAALLLIYFWKFSHVSLWTGFGQDDLMNLYFAWREPFTDVLKANLFFRTNVLRPFGSLFYATFFDWFGFNGFPFRAFCYAVMWGNVALAYAFARRVSGSREAGLLTALLHCHHGNYFPMYYGSGFCYDVFSFFFYYAAFTVALGGPLGVTSFGRCVAVAALYACAVNSKESAASLPVMLLIYAALRNSLRRLDWIWREGRIALATGGVALLFLWSRFTGPNNLLSHPDYTPVFTLRRYLESSAVYLNELCGRESLWTEAGAAWLLAGMGAIALLFRSRGLGFAWLLVIVASAPVAFVPPRPLASYYIPLLGYALYAATALVRSREYLMRRHSVRNMWVSQAALYLLVFALCWRWQLQSERRNPEHFQQLATINRMADQFHRNPDWTPHGSKLLIVNEPFPDYEWASSFIALLVSRDKTLTVDTLVKMDPKPTEAQIDGYATVLEWRGTQFVPADRSTVKQALP